MDTPANTVDKDGFFDDDAPWRSIEEELRDPQTSPEEDGLVFRYMRDDPPISGIAEALIIEDADDAHDEAHREMVRRFTSTVLSKGTWVRIK